MSNGTRETGFSFIFRDSTLGRQCRLGVQEVRGSTLLGSTILPERAISAGLIHQESSNAQTQDARQLGRLPWAGVNLDRRNAQLTTVARGVTSH
jgi:hypothetical protein